VWCFQRCYTEIGYLYNNTLYIELAEDFGLPPLRDDEIVPIEYYNIILIKRKNTEYIIIIIIIIIVIISYIIIYECRKSLI